MEDFRMLKVQSVNTMQRENVSTNLECLILSKDIDLETLMWALERGIAVVDAGLARRYSS
jgi:hypothetical protein